MTVNVSNLVQRISKNNCFCPFQCWHMFFVFMMQQTVKVITAKEPPLRHQTNRLYMPMTALKHADPTGRLPLDTFYKMIFKHDSVFNATLGVLRLLQRRTGKKQWPHCTIDSKWYAWYIVIDCGIHLGLFLSSSDQAQAITCCLCNTF